MQTGAAPGINEAISFQGKMTDDNGLNVADGNYQFVFNIYTVASAGSSVWTETANLDVADGVFYHNLGSINALPGSVDFNTDNIFLGITFNSDPDGEMSPRIQLTASPYAFNADALDGLDSSELVQLTPSAAQTGDIAITGSVSAGSLVLSDGSSNTGTIVVDDLGGDYIYTVPTTTADDTFCLENLDNCSGGGGGSLFTDGGAQTYLTSTGDTLMLGTTSSLNAKLAIVGTSDQSQFLVRANVTQTSPLMLVQDSTGAELFRVHATSGNSIFLGNLAGSSDDGTNNNATGIGFNALRDNTSGEYNTAVGSGTLTANTTGSFNAALGYAALNSNSTGWYNTAIGSAAMQNNSTGWRNTALGRSALFNSTGSDNIAIGSDAGDNLTAGDGNIIIGSQLDFANASGSNQLNIAGILTSSNYSSDNLVVGTSDTTGQLLVLDNKTDSGDPTGAQGGMYYNANSHKFRCYEGATGSGTWQDCISSGGGGVSLITGGGTGSTSSGSGLELNGSDLGLLQGCDDGQTLKWNEANSEWECGSDRATYQNVLSGDYTNATQTYTDVDDDATGNSDMGFPVGANETWIFEASLQSQSTGVADGWWRVTAPASTTCDISFSDPEWAITESNADCGVNSPSFSGDDNPNETRISGVVQTTSSGTVMIQHRQGGGPDGTNFVYAGSYIKAYKVSGADLAEAYYTTDSDIRPGTLVSIDPRYEAGVIRTSGAYDSRLIGVISTKPGLTLGDVKPAGTQGRPVMLGLTGRVPVRVSAENGPIQPGDYITSSSVPGVGMKASNAGRVIGRALSSFEGEGEGEVVVFLGNETRSASDYGLYSFGSFSPAWGGEIPGSEVNTDDIIAGGSHICYNIANVLTPCSSSRTLKHDITDNPYGLEEIRQLQSVSFAWNADNRQGIGFVAEDVAAIIPETTTYNPDGTVKSFNYDPIVSVLTRAVQQLDVQVQTNESRLGAVEEAVQPDLSGYVTTEVVQSLVSGLEARLTVLEEGAVENLEVSGSAVIAGNLTVSGLTTLHTLKIQGRIITAGNQPTAAVLGEGTVLVGGNDTAGEVSFTNTGTDAGQQFKVNFSQAFGNKPRINLTPISAAAAGTRYFVEPSTTGFIVTFIDVPDPGVYTFNYFAVE